MCLYRTLDPLLRNQENSDQTPKRFFDDTGLAGSSISKALKNLIGAGLINEIRKERGKTPIVELVIDQKEVYAKY